MEENQSINTIASTAEEEVPRPMWAVFTPIGHQAAPSNEAAGRLAAAMNEWTAGEHERNPSDPLQMAKVELWPESRLAHQLDMRQWPKACRVWNIQP